MNYEKLTRTPSTSEKVVRSSLSKSPGQLTVAGEAPDFLSFNDFEIVDLVQLKESLDYRGNFLCAVLADYLKEPPTLDSIDEALLLLYRFYKGTLEQTLAPDELRSVCYLVKKVIRSFRRDKEKLIAFTNKFFQYMLVFDGQKDPPQKWT